SPRPKPAFEMPAKPWHRRTPLTVARWEKASTPMMEWGPWYDPAASYRKLVEAHPEDIEAQLGLARTLVKDGINLFRCWSGTCDRAKIEQARDILRGLVAGKQPDPRAVYWLGLAQMQLGDGKEAVMTLGKLVGTPGETVAARLLLGVLALGNKEPGQAVRRARAAVALSPDSTLPRQLLALGLLQLDKPREARDELTPVRDQNPLEIGTLELLRRVAQAAGDAGEATALAAELTRLQKVAARQHEAGLAQLRAIERGELPDPHAIDTIAAPDPPGEEPGTVNE
ncbi:MAG TPA: hypothetical protein VNA25_06595, partial [Phycisphaerae bacterium]|nr:hypothetical protein [Phycisphaerae bacterium]